MPDTPFFPLRKECPPAVCDCKRELLLAESGADLRILRLTQIEEKKLIERIGQVSNYEELLTLTARMRDLLGIELTIAPGAGEVRTVLGLKIQLAERPGLCRKTHKTIPAAVRRCLAERQEIVFAILDAHDLFGLGRGG